MIIYEELKIKDLEGLPANTYCVIAPKHIRSMSDIELLKHFQVRRNKIFMIPRETLKKMYGDYLLSNVFINNNHSCFTIYKGE